MKKPVFIALAALVVNIFNSHAQYNVVKLGMSELLSLKTSVQYERILNESTSAHLTLNARPYINLPPFFYENILDVSTGATFQTSNIAVFPEFRIYTGFNIAPEGFYLGFQGKFAKTNIDLNGLFMDEVNSDISGSIRSFGGGLQLGRQWLISEQWTVDFYFLGITLQGTNFSGTVTSDDPNANFGEMATSLEENVDGVPVLQNLEVTSSSNSLSVSLQSFTLGFRTGVSVGFAF